MLLGGICGAVIGAGADLGGGTGVGIAFWEEEPESSILTPFPRSSANPGFFLAD
jgi:hypothetical protein